MYGHTCACMCVPLQSSLLKQLKDATLCPQARSDLIHNDRDSLRFHKTPAENLGVIFFFSSPLTHSLSFSFFFILIKADSSHRARSGPLMQGQAFEFPECLGESKRFSVPRQPPRVLELRAKEKKKENHQASALPWLC